MTTEERKKQEKHLKTEMILDRAQDLIFQSGFQKTTMDEIARASGYSKRSVYMYFHDREEILFAITARGQIILTKYLRDASINARNEGTLERFAKAFFHFSLDYPEFFELVMGYEAKKHDYTDGHIDDETPRGSCQNLSVEYGEIVLKAINEDLENGKLKSSLTAKQLLLFFWGQIFGISQILTMRMKDFSQVYGEEPDQLFQEYIIILQNLYDRGF